MRYLTKSRFKLAVECPRKLYYSGKSEYRDRSQADTFMKGLAEGGFQVGEMAKLLYPEGIEVTAKGNAQAIAETAELLKRDKVTLFEPAIAAGPFLVRVDILVKSGNRIRLIEVKAKSVDPAKPGMETKKGLSSEYRPYVEDIAFQAFVVQLAFPDAAVTTYLMMPDKSCTAAIDRMNQLFKIEHHLDRTSVKVSPDAFDLTREQTLIHEFNVGHLVEIVHRDGIKFPGGEGALGGVARAWAEAYLHDRPLTAALGVQCAKCQFKAEESDELKCGFTECWAEANGWNERDFAEPTILDLWNFRGKAKLMQQGVRRLSEVTYEDLSARSRDRGLSDGERQWLQINGLPEEHEAAGYYLDHAYMREELASWRFPYHFIDFETSAVALPFHRGMRPYENVAFQFSHHVLEADGTLRHANQFLCAEPGVFPNYRFVRALREAMGADNGSVFRWAEHEQTILRHIRTQLQTRDDAPEDRGTLIEFINDLVDDGPRAMVDLRQVAKLGFFHPVTKGSSSIKQVLPAALACSTALKAAYIRPDYGSAGGVPSLNFTAMQWWQTDQNGRVLDPYKLLGSLTAHGGKDDLQRAISAGGDAAMAYGKLQFEELDATEREVIEQQLFRYCELDTLAMAMIVQFWQDVTLN
ncbi:MAG: DUF2779 domain-containing protein [Sphingomonadales bacterium]|nr:DUF2779 domain-containing protein [Sphingomonadales bacterium]